jgi:hypothetical protein
VALSGVVPETPIAVKIVTIDGRPHFCSVIPPVPPREIDRTWQPNPRAYHGPRTPDFEADGILGYITTRFDQEN